MSTAAPARRGVFGPLTRAHALAAARRGWLHVVVALGVAGIAAAGVAAALADGQERSDDLRSGVANVVLYGGLLVACGLGATVVNRPSRSGHLGLLVASGVRREETVLAAVAGRAATLAAVLAAWGVASQAASAAAGRGLDGDLAVHVLAALPTCALSLAAAALASAAFAPVASAVVGLSVHITAQAIVNLKAAADTGVIGDVAEPAIDAAYAFLPHVVVSPMISALQVRDAAPFAAPRFEVNEVVVPIPASSAASVVWTVAWTVLLTGLAALAVKRRPL